MNRIKYTVTVDFHDNAPQGLWTEAAEDMQRMVSGYAGVVSARSDYGELIDFDEVGERLEYLRGELRAGCMSWGELAELQSLANEIDPGDVELLEAAGVPEGGYTCRHCGRLVKQTDRGTYYDPSPTDANSGYEVCDPDSGQLHEVEA